MTFYCQSCGHEIDVLALASLNNGQCPKCNKTEGFGSVPKESMPETASQYVLNDSDFLQSKPEDK